MISGWFMASKKSSRKGSEQKHAFRICNWTEEDGEKRLYKEWEREKEKEREDGDSRSNLEKMFFVSSDLFFFSLFLFLFFVSSGYLMDSELRFQEQIQFRKFFPFTKNTCDSINVWWAKTTGLSTFLSLFLLQRVIQRRWKKERSPTMIENAISIEELLVQNFWITSTNLFSPSRV